MTYFITAFTNDKARLIASQTRTDSEVIAKLVVREYEATGHLVVCIEED